MLCSVAICRRGRLGDIEISVYRPTSWIIEPLKSDVQAAAEIVRRERRMTVPQESMKAVVELL